jgi:hypothetical protein
MIISFSLQNWMSYKDEAQFTMLAGKEQGHSERLARIDKYGMRILPVAAIYAEGTFGEFFKALAFAQKLVLSGSVPDEAPDCIPANPHRPASFFFELLINETAYELSFSLNRNEIVEEHLVEILSTREKVLYSRENGAIELEQSMENKQAIEDAFSCTEKRQLFLTKICAHQEIASIMPVYTWFRDSLVFGLPKMPLGDNTRVHVIDGVDQELQGERLAQFLKGFLEKCSETGRTQLVFTTGNALLMDSDLLRKDEIWLAQRNQHGHSSLTAISEYKDVYSDKNIRKSYLQGRFGTASPTTPQE